LISDSYLDQMETRCSEHGVSFERKHFDGKNFEAIVADVTASDYDLVVVGALGMGAVKDSQAGSVCERVLRRIDVDTFVVRSVEEGAAHAPGPIVACIDGSSRSHGAVRAAIALGKALSRQVQLVAVQEPDRPDSALLQAHLDLARRAAREAGVSAAATLLEG